MWLFSWSKFYWFMRFTHEYIRRIHLSMYIYVCVWGCILLSIEPKIDYILGKDQNGFRRNKSMTSQILTIGRILEGVHSKNLQATILFVDFTKAFDSINREKMEQILFAYGLPKQKKKKTVAAIMMLYRNIKVNVRSPDGDTDYFDIVAGVLQGDIQAPYLFIIFLDYVLRTSIDKIKENGFKLTKEKKQKVPRKKIYWRRLCRWHNASGKCTHSNRNPAT